MSPLLLKASLRHFLRHPWQAGLAALGVAIGIAVVVAIQVANQSALRAFRLSAEAVSGRATHQIVGGSAGVPEALYRELRLEHGVRNVAPVIEVHIRPTGSPEQGLRLLGIDPFAEARFRTHLGEEALPRFDLTGFMTRNGAFLAADTASELGVREGEALHLERAGRQRSVEILGFLEPTDDFARKATADLVVVDLGTAQRIAGLRGRLTRIDLLLPEGADRHEEINRLRDLLPPDLSIVRPESRSAAAEQMTRAFRLNLQALSLLALLCGAFLIFNTITFAVIQRRPLLGILRTLGVTREEILVLVVSEAILIGAIGSLLGLLAGRLLAESLLARVTQTINDLYFVLNVQRIEIPTSTLLLALATGVGVSVVAALVPALEAMTTAPRSTLDRAELESRVHDALPRVTTVGALLGAAGLFCLWLPGEGLLSGFVGLFLVLVGLTLLTPSGTSLLMRILSRPAGILFGGLGRLATRSVVASLSRTGIAVAALMMAVSVTVGVDIMIRSFRQTVESWLVQVLPADLYLTTPAFLSDRFTSSPPALEPALLDRLENLPGIDRVNTVRHAQVETNVGPVRLSAYELDDRGRAGFSFKAGDPEKAWLSLALEEGAIITEPFAYRHKLDLGDSLMLTSPSGPRRLAVTGIVYDYATDQGRLLVTQSFYEKLWVDRSRTAASIWVAQGFSIEQVASEARLVLRPDREVVIRSNGELREESIRIFDRTFLITGVLRLLAVAVAFVGILSALTALQLERAREFGVLRASGLTPHQVWGLVTTQTGLMGMAAGLFSLPVGVIMAVILVYIINRRSFGWSLSMTVSPLSLGIALALALGASLLAGLYPAYRMARVSPAEALRDE
jgi:putative ABC transport system permease protein